MLSRQKFLTSANIVLNRLFPEPYIITFFCIRLFATVHPLSLRTHFRLNLKRISRHTRNNNIPEMTDLLRCWSKLEIFGWNELEIDYMYIKHNNPVLVKYTFCKYTL